LVPAALAGGAISTARPAEKLTGIWLGNLSVPLGAKQITAIHQPWVDGAYLDLHWAQIEPQADVYDWTAVDKGVAIVAAAGKKVSLGIAAGRFSPDWAKQTLPTLHTVAPSAPFQRDCTEIDAPNPWTPQFIDAWTKMVAAFGAHYANNPSVISVKFGGLNFNTPELMVPHFTGTMVGGCKTHDDVDAAIKMGATEEKIIDAFKSILNAYARDFPAQYIVIQGCGIPFVPAKAIGFGGNNAVSGAYACPQYMVPYGRRLLGRRFVVQNNDWREGAFTRFPGDTRTAVEYGRTGGVSGMQLANTLDHDCVGRPSCDERATLEVMVTELEQNTNTDYVEAFPGSINNPDLSQDWLDLENWLHARN
jgi:hypothetical protein